MHAAVSYYFTQQVYKKGVLTCMHNKCMGLYGNLTIPRARMRSESIAHEAEDLTGYWLRGHEGERDNCFSKIQLVGQKYRDKNFI